MTPASAAREAHEVVVVRKLRITGAQHIVLESWCNVEEARRRGGVSVDELETLKSFRVLLVQRGGRQSTLKTTQSRDVADAYIDGFLKGREP